MIRAPHGVIVEIYAEANPKLDGTRFGYERQLDGPVDFEFQGPTLVIVAKDDEGRIGVRRVYSIDRAYLGAFRVVDPGGPAGPAVMATPEAKR